METSFAIAFWAHDPRNSNQRGTFNVHRSIAAVAHAVGLDLGGITPGSGTELTLSRCSRAFHLHFKRSVVETSTADLFAVIVLVTLVRTTNDEGVGTIGGRCSGLIVMTGGVRSCVTDVARQGTGSDWGLCVTITVLANGAGS